MPKRKKRLMRYCDMSWRSPSEGRLYLTPELNEGHGFTVRWFYDLPNGSHRKRAKHFPTYDEAWHCKKKLQTAPRRGHLRRVQILGFTDEEEAYVVPLE